MSRFSVNIIKTPTELRKTQMDQAGEPTLSIASSWVMKRLATKQLKLLGVMLSWLERDEISVPHGASNEKRIIGVVLTPPQMHACALAALS